MSDKLTRPHGLWSSPLSARAMAGQLRLTDVTWAGDALVWCEGRDGRGVIVAQPRGQAPRDVTTEDHSARGGVGYGGGPLGARGEVIWFAGADGRLYRVGVDHGTPSPITPAFGRLASPTPSPDGDLIAFVHTYEGADVIAVVDAQGHSWPQRLIVGADFYMQPAWHPSGDQLAWVEWDHPNMPWDGTRLMCATLERGPGGLALGQPTQIAGGDEVAAQQPIWSPSGDRLAYLSDVSGFWHLYVRQDDQTQQLSTGEVDHAGPAWVQGLRSMAWAPDGGSILAVRSVAGRAQLWRCPLEGQPEPLEALQDYESMGQLAVSSQGQLALVASASRIPPRVVTADVSGEAAPRVARRASAEQVPASALAPMRPVSWLAPDGTQVHGNFYAPTSRRFEGAGDQPPAIVMIHGGPTSQRTAAFEARSQFFATRGWAVLDVNYRGSTGYGRAYMEALMGKWGVLDVEDAVGAVEFLGQEGLADPERVAIMGGSAGGYTVLHALVKHPGVFAAGVSMYGISNLFTLAAGTHKFEASYNDSLIGPLPQAAELYRERSPIFHVEALQDPVAIFQGDEDKVVPRDQADRIVDSLRARGVPHEYHVYEGEGHGWRRAETIEHFYEATLAFLKTHVLFA